MLQIEIVNDRKFIRFKVFVQFKTFYADEISVRLLDGQSVRNTCAVSKKQMHSVFLRMARFIYVLNPLCICQYSGPGPLAFLLIHLKL